MNVTFYSRPDIQACARVRRTLDKFAAEYGLSITEASIGAEFTAASGQRVKVPAIAVEGSRLNILDSSRGAPDEATIRAYFELARATGASGASTAARGRAQTHPARSLGAEHKRRSALVKTYLWQHRVGAIISAISAFVGLSLAAPLLPSGLYSAVFNAYRWVCVQTPERSPLVGGHQGCLCWRCIAIYTGSLIFGILYALGRDGRLPHMKWLTQGIGLKGLVLFSLPMFVDGLSHTFGLRPGVAYAHSPDFWLGWGEFQADWWARVLTSLFATVGAVRFLCPRLDRIALSYPAPVRKVRALAGLAAGR